MACAEQAISTDIERAERSASSESLGDQEPDAAEQEESRILLQRRSNRIAANEQKMEEAARQAVAAAGAQPERKVVKRRKPFRTQMEKVHPAPKGVDTAGRGWNQCLGEPCKLNEFSRDSVVSFRSHYHPQRDSGDWQPKEVAYAPSLRHVPPNAPEFQTDAPSRRRMFTADEQANNSAKQNQMRTMLMAAIEEDPEIGPEMFEPRIRKRRKRMRPDLPY